MKKALVLEDHNEAREMLTCVALKAIPNIRVDQVATIQQAKRWLRLHRYDLAILDISLPDGSGIDFISNMLRSNPSVYIVMATIHDGDEYVFNALRAGAKGYLLKDQAIDELVASLKGIVSGQPPLSPSIAHAILNYFHQKEEPIKDKLTPREIEVLTLLAKGYSRKSIAELLKISHHTVADFIKKIYSKLGVHSSVEASLEAARMGLVNIDK